MRVPRSETLPFLYHFFFLPFFVRRPAAPPKPVSVMVRRRTPHYSADSSSNDDPGLAIVRAPAVNAEQAAHFGSARTLGALNRKLSELELELSARLTDTRRVWQVTKVKNEEAHVDNAPSARCGSKVRGLTKKTESERVEYM